MALAFEEVGEEHLVEALGDVDGLVVYLVLDGVLADEGVLLGDGLLVAFGDFGGLELEMASCFEVDEFCRAVAEEEVHFVGLVEGVEEDDFVLAVAQVAQGVEERVVFVGGDEGVGEDDDEGAAVELFGCLVEGLADDGL